MIFPRLNSRLLVKDEDGDMKILQNGPGRTVPVKKATSVEKGGGGCVGRNIKTYNIQFERKY